MWKHYQIPVLKVCDLEAMAVIAKNIIQFQLLTIFRISMGTNPTKYGFDLVIHSEPNILVAIQI